MSLGGAGRSKMSDAAPRAVGDRRVRLHRRAPPGGLLEVTHLQCIREGRGDDPALELHRHGRSGEPDPLHPGPAGIREAAAGTAAAPVEQFGEQLRQHPGRHVRAPHRQVDHRGLQPPPAVRGPRQVRPGRSASSTSPGSSSGNSRVRSFDGVGTNPGRTERGHQLGEHRTELGQPGVPGADAVGQQAVAHERPQRGEHLVSVVRRTGWVRPQLQVGELQHPGVGRASGRRLRTPAAATAQAGRGTPRAGPRAGRRSCAWGRPPAGPPPSRRPARRATRARPGTGRRPS